MDLWGVVGEELAGHLAPLALSGRKLVAIYVDRAKRRASGAGPLP